jgi:hypothetical protein
MMTVVTGEGRKVATEAEQLAAFRSMVAYSGRYRLEGEDKFTTKVEVAWNEAWVGTDQARTYKLEGDTLYIIAATQPNPNFGNRIMTGILSWEREK